MLWNCGHGDNRDLRPHKVNTMDGLYLHRFKWLMDNLIGKLDPGWNFLVDEYNLEEFGKDNVKNVHFTNFGPWLDGHEDVDFADEWFAMREEARRIEQE